MMRFYLFLPESRHFFSFCSRFFSYSRLSYFPNYLITQTIWNSFVYILHPYFTDIIFLCFSSFVWVTFFYFFFFPILILFLLITTRMKASITTTKNPVQSPSTLKLLKLQTSRSLSSMTLPLMPLQPLFSHSYIIKLITVTNINGNFKINIVVRRISRGVLANMIDWDIEEMSSNPGCAITIICGLIPLGKYNNPLIPPAMV